MTLLGVEALLARPGARVQFMASADNATLLEKLRSMATRHPELEIHVMQRTSTKLEALRNRLAPSRVAGLAAELAAHHPDLVVAVQGNIEHSSLSLLAARRAGLRSASYIPVPHSNAEMGAKLGWLRDRFTSGLFQAADHFVTITDEMGAKLRARGATCPITVVYNGVDTTRFISRPAAECRGKLGLPGDRVLIGMVGRIEFRQKQQHLLLDAIASEPALRNACHLVFAGGGPDQEELATRAGNHGMADTVTILPWCDPADLYPALHALVIPSRYEGLPLVMLEALCCGTTVLGSDRDGMKDVLPASRRFPPGGPRPLATALRRFLDDGAPAAEPALTARVRDTMNLPAFSHAFRRAMEKAAAQPRSDLATPETESYL